MRPPAKSEQKSNPPVLQYGMNPASKPPYTPLSKSAPFLVHFSKRFAWNQ